MVDKVLLKKKMRAAGIRNQTELAKLLGITRNTLSKKINGPSEFKASEVGTLFAMLRLTPRELDLIFFPEEGETDCHTTTFRYARKCGLVRNDGDEGRRIAT